MALQCCWRRKTARRELRRRRKEAQEAGKLLQDKQALDAKLKETLAILETVQNQRNDLRQACKVRLPRDGSPIAHAHPSKARNSGSQAPGQSMQVSIFCLQEERASRETAEALLAAAQEESEKSLAELRSGMEAQLAGEVAAHATTKDQLEAVKKQVASLNTAAEAARAQLQAHSISSQQRTAQFERQKADLEVRHPGIAGRSGQADPWSVHRVCRAHGPLNAVACPGCGSGCEDGPHEPPEQRHQAEGCRPGGGPAGHPEAQPIPGGAGLGHPHPFPRALQPPRPRSATFHTLSQSSMSCPCMMYPPNPEAATTSVCSVVSLD